MIVGPPSGPACAGRVTIRLPDDDAVNAVAARLHSAEHRYERDAATLSVTDPSGNPLRFTAEE